MIARNPGTRVVRIPLCDGDGRARDRGEAIAMIAGRTWAIGSRYLGTRGAWHLFECTASAEQQARRLGYDQRRPRAPHRAGRPVSGPPARRTTRAMLRAVIAASADLCDPDVMAMLATRPRTRADCVGGERPCPWASCRHNLLLEVNPETGSIKMNHPSRELEELADTCSLDVADRGPQLPAITADRLNLTRSRVAQVERSALRRLRGSGRLMP